jgi:hypothetical protein
MRSAAYYASQPLHSTQREVVDLLLVDPEGHWYLVLGTPIASLVSPQVRSNVAPSLHSGLGMGGLPSLFD